MPSFTLAPGKVFLCPDWLYRDGESSDKRVIIASNIVADRVVCLLTTSQPRHFPSAVPKCNFNGEGSFFQIEPANSANCFQVKTFVKFEDAYFPDASKVLGLIRRDLGALGQCWSEIKNCIRRTMREEMSGMMYNAICN